MEHNSKTKRSVSLQTPTCADAESAEILLRQAEGLLAGTGYSRGRVRRTHTATVTEKCDIRAPGPTPPPTTETPLSDFASQSTPKSFVLNRSSVAFRRARVTPEQNWSKSGIGRSPKSTKCARRSSNSQSPTLPALSLEDKQRLRGLFSGLKAEETLKVTKQLQSRFRNKDKLGVFPANVNRIRLETTQISEFGHSLKTRIRPLISQAKAQFLSRTPQTDAQFRSEDERESLRQRLEVTLVDRFRNGGEQRALKSREPAMNEGRLRWFASEGLKRFAPRACSGEARLFP